MNNKGLVLRAGLISSVFFFLLIASPLSNIFAQVQREVPIISLKGKVEVLRAGKTDWQPAHKAQVLKKDDTIRTGVDGTAVLAIEGVGAASMINVASSTELKLSDLTLDENSGAENTLLEMAIGDVLVKTEPKQGSNFQVKTPTSIVGARGTAFRVKEYQS